MIINPNVFKLRLIYLSICFASTMTLQGCVSDAPLTTRDEITRWQLSGKIAVIYPEAYCNSETCRRQSDQGKINWKQNEQTYHVAISDPFGRQLMQLSGNERTLTATSPEKTPVVMSPNDFIQLMTSQTDQTIGADLAPADLRFWVTGRPNPKLTATDKNTQTFVQKGYEITAKQWRKTPIGYVPALVVVEKDGFTLRLVVREWENYAKP